MSVTTTISPRRKPGPAGAFTPALGDAFLALLRETGNARASARALGHRHLFNNRMRRDPVFAAACRAAAAHAQTGLAAATRHFVLPVEVKGMPPGGPRMPPGPMAIRRTSNGRLQRGAIREGAWTPEAQEIFLERLRATGNIRWSARAAGFDPSTVYREMAKWPAFAAECDEAQQVAEVKLDYELIAYAHALLRRPGAPRDENQPGDEWEDKWQDDIPFDPDQAMRILSFIERRRAGRTARGRRKGPPDRCFDEAVSSMLAKIEAIERHQRMMREQGKDPNGDNCP